MRQLTKNEIENAPDWATHYWVSCFGGILYQSNEFFQADHDGAKCKHDGFSSDSKPIPR